MLTCDAVDLECADETLGQHPIGFAALRVRECWRRERCSMIEMIGITTLCMLVWLLASSMATESDAEKRRVAMLTAPIFEGATPGRLNSR